MPTITNSPILTDTIGSSTGPAYELTPMLFQRGSNFYQILIDYGALGFGTLKTFLSTDQGASWIVQDAASSPDAGAQSGYFYMFDDPGRNAIDVLYRTGQENVPGAQIRICTFSTATNTWGAPSLAFNITTIPGNANQPRYCFYKQSGGPWVVISSRVSFFPSVFRIYYLTFNGVSWSGPTDLTTTNNDGDDVWGGRLHSGGVFHFLASNGFSLLYYQVSPTFVLSTKVALSPPNVFFASFPERSMSMAFWGSDSFVVTYVSTAGTIEGRIGTPLSAPVFTSYVIFTAGFNDFLTYATPIVSADGTLNNFFILQDTSLSPDKNQILQSVFNGSSWGSNVIFYDANLDPPPGVTVELIHKFDAIQLINGDWIVSTMMGLGSSEHGNIAFVLTTSQPGCPTIFVARQSQPDAPSPAAPPITCTVYTPTTSTPSFISYDEPLELQGS